MRMKRFLAGFLCLCMVGTMDMPYVQAAAVAAKSEPVAQESAKQDAEDAKPSEDVENQDNDQRSEAAKQIRGCHRHPGSRTGRECRKHREQDRADCTVELCTHRSADS